MARFLRLLASFLEEQVAGRWTDAWLTGTGTNPKPPSLQFCWHSLSKYEGQFLWACALVTWENGESELKPWGVRKKEFLPPGKELFVVDVCLFLTITFLTIIFKRRVERKMLLKATMTSKMAAVPSSTVFEKRPEADCSSNVLSFHSYYLTDRNLNRTKLLPNSGEFPLWIALWTHTRVKVSNESIFYLLGHSLLSCF